MYRKEAILVAVDPSREQHPALERVLENARYNPIKPHLHLFIAVDCQSVDETRYPMSTPLAIVNALAARVTAEGIKHSVELCWTSRWQQGMLDAAKKIKADLIVMTDHSNVSRKIALADSKWALLRRANRPVLLVRSDGSAKRETVLAAVNMQAKTEEQAVLNKRIIITARSMAEYYQAEFHVVNACRDNHYKPDRAEMERLADIASHRVHVQIGEPENVVSYIAGVIGADVVVIGTMARRGVIESIRGNRSERVLNSLTQDVLTLN